MEDHQIISEAFSAVTFLSIASLHAGHGWAGPLLIAIGFLAAFHLGMKV